MELTLKRASEKDAGLIWRMQIESFAQMYERYRDDQTSPAKEPIDKVIARLRQPYTYYYLIETGGETAGAIRVVDFREEGNPKRISPLFILPGFRNHGLAQAAIRAVERIHGQDNWALDTIAQEEGNCRLYEKMGYRQTGKTEAINDSMTLVFYEKK
ncbi:MAG: GNAT family N-acetyltransferase [Clostridiales bacterium]|nr:GNAT family N-acetyltransferase [Clostridiales bacterium]